MNVSVDEMPKHPSPNKSKRKKMILIASVIGLVITMIAGIYVMMTPPEPTYVEQNVTIPKSPAFDTNFTYEIGIIPASFNQHVVKITHSGGESITNMTKDLWITVYPPDSTPYQRRTPAIHVSKYPEFVEEDVLYIYLGKDQIFYAAKELPDYDTYVDFPNGDWEIHIDDARFKLPISEYKFTIEKSKTHLVNSKQNTRIDDLIKIAEPFDTIFIKGDMIYRERLTITDKPIRLYSLDGAVIDAGGSGSVITFDNAAYSEISGFNIINSGTDEAQESGILLKYSNHIIIRNNTVHNNQNGIYLIGSLNNDIRYNHIHTNDITGLSLVMSSNSNTIKENNFQQNTFGIYVRDSSDTNYIVNNKGSDNTRFGILLDNKLKNIYEYNDFGYDIMSYNRVAEQNLTTFSEDKSNWDDWFSTCGSHESLDSPACKGK